MTSDPDGGRDVPMTQWLHDAQAGDDDALARVWAAGLDEPTSCTL